MSDRFRYASKTTGPFPRASLRALLRDSSAGIAVYGAFVAVLAIGAGAVAVDIGRMTVLKSELQNSADARAMAAALQLDGRPGAQSRATELATATTTEASNLSADGTDFQVSAINFYTQVEPDLVPATGDGNSGFVEVVMTPKPIDFYLKPVLDFFNGRAGSDSGEIDARAIAGSQPFICHAPPLMICDFLENNPPLDLRDPANAGRQLRLKEVQGSGSSQWAPGNFGLLSLPDGTSGASAIERALAAVVPQDCYGYDVTTAPGSQTNKVKNGINARFDVNSWPHPAPNVINYPRDQELIASSTAKLGSGSWDLDGYWSAKHNGQPVPAAIDLPTTTRYQTYLYELGLEFGRNGAQTIYPVDNPAALPAGFDLVTPPGADIPVAASPANRSNPDFDGVPQRTPASNGQARRLVQVVQLECVAEQVKGKGTYPTKGNYLEIFITETVRGPPEAAIYGEIVRAVSTASNPNFHANVQLVR